MSDLGPLLAAVGDEWERGLVIAQRAGIDARTAGPKLASLEREGFVAASWTDSFGGVKLYRRGPNAPPQPARRVALTVTAEEARILAAAYFAGDVDEEAEPIIRRLVEDAEMES